MILKSLRLAEKGSLDLSLTEPPLLMLYLVLPFFILICLVICFLFHQGSIQTSLANWAPLTKYCLK